MSSFKKRINKNSIKWIITFTLLSLLLVSVVFAFVKIDRNEKTKKLGTSSFTYAIGLLNEKGEYEQGTSSIYLKDFCSVDGLTVEVIMAVAYSLQRSRGNVYKQLKTLLQMRIKIMSILVL